MKKKVLLLMACFMALVLVLAACGGGDDNETGDEPDTNVADNNGGEEGEDEPNVDEEFDGLPEGIYQDANGNYRFEETREISVALWNRTDGIEAPDTYWAHWIQEQMLEIHNIQVTFENVPRWDETDFQAAQLSAGTAPDVGYTFNAGLVGTMATMDGLINLFPYLQRYGQIFPNMFDQVTERNVFWNHNPDTDELYSITGRRATEGIQNTVTFIREDWLDALDLPIPTSTQEFEDTLKAFRDRADELPGIGSEGRIRAYFETPEGGWGDIPDEEGYRFEWVTHDLNAEDVIPYLLGNDSGWWGRGLFQSFIPNDISEREWFVYGFDDRHFMHRDAMREGIRIFNYWYNEGLLWDDFVLAAAEDADDRIRLGLVGAFHHTWDQPFRPGANGWTTIMRENVGEDANFIVINPFENDAGVHRKFASGPTDRFAFLPHTNTEVIASLLYLDFMNRPETLTFLQFGYEGVHYELVDGIRHMLPADDFPQDQRFSGPRNFDINPLMNGVWFDLVDSEEAFATAAVGYPGITPETIMGSLEIAQNNTQVFRQVVHRTIDAQEGMGVLADERDQIFHRLIASPQVTQDNFDAMFDAEYQGWLVTGAQAIIDERAEAWFEMFQDAGTMPDALDE